jgi:glucokinase
MLLGIEIGGTKLQLGLGAGDGTLRGLWRSDVAVQQGADGIRRQIVSALPELLRQAGLERSALAGIGIGFGGPVDDVRRTVIKSHQIGGWDDFPLADWLGDLVGLPAVLGNDADVAGLAEALFGAGKGLSPIFYVTVGSGIGGGLIIDGAIHRGCGRGAAEIGHLRLPRTSHGGLRRTIVEESASGWAIEAEARALGPIRGHQATPALKAMIQGDWQKITARHLAQAAGNDDPFAWEVLRPAWEALAEAICQVIALICPRRFVIGGGISLIGDKVLFEPLRKLVSERVFAPFAQCYDVVPAALGEEVVVHGALALAARKLGRGALPPETNPR